MTRHTDLHDVLNGLLVPSEEKVAGDLSALNLFELGELMGIKTAGVEKKAYGVLRSPMMDQETWLQQFSGSPLYEKAIALAERELAVEQKMIADREKRKKEFRLDDGLWKEQDKLRLERDKLILELHKHRAKEQAKNVKVAEDVEYTGQVNNGVPSNPEWPRAALGVDAAGRRATPEERREQEKVVTPDVQHVEPHSDGGQFVSKGAHDEKLLGLFTKKAVSEEWLSKRLGDAAAKRVLGPIDRIFKGDAIRREVKDRLVGSRDATRALKGMGVLKTTQPEAVFKRHDAREVIKDIRELSQHKTSSLAAVGAVLRRPF